MAVTSHGELEPIAIGSVNSVEQSVSKRVQELIPQYCEFEFPKYVFQSLEDMLERG